MDIGTIILAISLIIIMFGMGITLRFSDFANIWKQRYLVAVGVTLQYTVPPGWNGNTVRLQAFVISSLALNGVFAATDVHDIVFQ